MAGSCFRMKIAMTPNWWRALFIIAVLTHAAGNEALACSCGGTGGPPCQAAWAADVVFAGTVRAVQQMDHETLGAPCQFGARQVRGRARIRERGGRTPRDRDGRGRGRLRLPLYDRPTLSGVRIENAILAPVHGHLLANATARQGRGRHSLLDVDARDRHGWKGVRASP